MERIDVAIIALGVVVLVSSLVGVALYEPEGGQTFLVAFGAAPLTSDTQQASVSGSGEATFTHDVSATRLAYMVVTVQVNTGNVRPQADTITVTVTNPQGATMEGECQIAAGAQGGGCEVPINFTVLELDPVTVSGTDEADAGQNAIDGLPTSGAGQWQARVQIDSGAGGVPLPGQIEPTYGVVVVFDPYAPTVRTVTVATPEIRGGP